jgi:hypothetical protein
MQTLKNKASFLLFLLFFFPATNLFAKESTVWTGYAGGKEIKTGWVTGYDLLCYDVNKT